MADAHASGACPLTRVEVQVLSRAPEINIDSMPSRLALSLLFAFCLSFFPIGNELANALTVSPVKLEVQGDPGTTASGTFVLFNEQNTSQTFYVSYADFEAEGETGAPHFIKKENALSSWIRLIPSGMDSVVLAAGERLEVPYEILIPAEASPGGYFGAIFWGSNPNSDEDAETMSIGAQVGILLFLSVNGEVDEDGGLLSFSLEDNSAFFTHLPIGFEYRFQNNGGDRVIPTGTLTIKNSFGMNAETLSLNAAQSNVLPTSTRLFEERWGSDLADLDASYFDMVGEQWDQFAFGYYRADLALEYGHDDTTVNSAVHFWVFPWQLLSFILGLCFAFGFGFYVTLKRYNRWIISQAMAARATRTKKSAKKASKV